MDSRGFQHYKEQSINTMTPNELLLMLYDELVKRLVRCDLALKKEDWPLFETSVDRSIAIIRYLDDTLDQKYAISHDLHRLYDYFLYELSRVQAGRNKEVLDRVRPMIADLRDTFREADKNCSEEK